MNLRQLGYFLKISEVESMTRAASVLHVAQPSLTRQMQTLEQELGVLLFIRSDKGVKLTEAGHALREQAGAVLQQVNRIRDDLKLLANEPRGELRFDLPASMFDFITMPLLEIYRQRYPKVQLRVTESINSSIQELLLNGRLDTAVVSDAEPLDMLRSQALLCEQLYLVGTKRHGFLEQDSISLKDTVRFPFVLKSRSSALRTIVDRHFAKNDVQIAPVIEADSSRLLCELAARGKGVTILPFSAIAGAYRERQISISPLKDMSVTWTMVSARERGIPLSVRKLRDSIIEIANMQISTGLWHGILPIEEQHLARKFLQPRLLSLAV